MLYLKWQCICEILLMLSIFKKLQTVPAFLNLKYRKTSFTFPNNGETVCSATCVPPSRTKTESVSLARQLQAKIKAMGPITVAEYMKEVLTNPVSGYYMHRDVIGETGDFITSPELGQLFGEMVAVWCFNEWQKMGSPIPLQLVEMGPGRGSLAEDVLRRTEVGWREVLIDIDPAAGTEKFRYVISRTPTPASKTLIKADEKRDHVEVCAESGVILEHLATRLEEDGGFALFADYGHDGSKTDTFRGFRNHELHDALVDPGSADLTADVDFSYIRACTEDKLLTFGPVTQRDFLKQMGIDVRLQILLQNCDEKQKENLLLGYHMMVDEDKMGERFKLFSLFPSVLRDHLERFPVSGFADS